MADKQFKDWTNTATQDRRDRLPINKFSDDKDYHFKWEDLLRSFPFWDSGITYADGDFVAYADKIYFSIQGSNTNQQPDTSPTYWTEYGGGGGASFSYGVIKSASSVDGDFTDVQDWQGSGPYTSEIEHGFTIDSGQPYKVGFRFYQLVSGTNYIEVTPTQVETIDNTKIKVTMLINNDLYVVGLG